MHSRPDGHVQLFDDARKLRAYSHLRADSQSHCARRVYRVAHHAPLGMDEACCLDRGLSHVASYDVETRHGACCQQRHENRDSGTAHDYFLSNTITRAGFEPRTDSTVMVLPSGDNDLVSLRTTFGPPATALSLVLLVSFVKISVPGKLRGRDDKQLAS